MKRTKHIKIISNDRVIIDKRIEACYWCPLYYLDTDEGPYCNADDEEEHVRNEMNEDYFISDVDIPRICPLDDVKE